MNKKIIMLFIIILIFSICIISCNTLKFKDQAHYNQSNTKQNKSNDNHTDLSRDKNENNHQISDIIQQQLDSMTIDEKIGQMLMFGIEGYNENDNTVKLIQQHHVGGLIFFRRNIKDTNQLLSLINSLKQTNQKNSLPLILSVDEEGGKITRMPPEFIKIPSQQIIGSIDSNQFAFEIGGIIAKRIGAFGLNMALTPVLDINSNPDNPVIKDRAYGKHPDLVARMGIQELNGIKQQGIIPVIKHFPGHGDTDKDSHTHLPILKHDLDRLENFELIPFKKAINNGADVVMVGHILLPKIDAENPCSLSNIIITNILRNRLGFNGIVMTDDLTMDAISQTMDLGQAAIKAVNAGNDIISICHNYNAQIEVIKSLKDAVTQGIISQQRIDESVYRIISLKQKYNLNDNLIQQVDVQTINNETQAILNKYLDIANNKSH